ncbi:MAG: VanZ family protein, partial [Planctomycetes bacterium]|nr:VanZ family protein [Planctomycetota bacterium]
MARLTWRSQVHPRRVVATVLLTLGVLGLTHLPREAVPPMLEGCLWDKAEHALAYGLIAASFLLSLRRPVRPSLLLTGLAAMAVLGVLDEITQPLVRRTASPLDYAGDLIGVAVVYAVFLA